MTDLAVVDLLRELQQLVEWFGLEAATGIWIGPDSVEMRATWLKGGKVHIAREVDGEIVSLIKLTSEELGW
jgi:hypothetical protein